MAIVKHVLLKILFMFVNMLIARSCKSYAEFQQPRVLKFLNNNTLRQWHNRRGGGGRRKCPLRLFPGEYLLTYREMRDERKWEKKRTEIVKGKVAGKVENFKWKGKNGWKWAEDFLFSLLFTFWNHWNLLESTKMEISARKKHFTPVKSGKVTLSSPAKYSCYATALRFIAP